MEVGDLFPEPGHVQQLYCSACGRHLDLAFADWSRNVSGIAARVSSWPRRA
jgi:hypothetical protein